MTTKEFTNELERVLSVYDYSFVYYYFGKVTPNLKRSEHFAMVHFTDEFGRDRYGIFTNDSIHQTKEIEVIECANYAHAKRYLQNIMI